MNAPLTFAPIYMPRVWGGRDLEARFGRSLPGSGPVGESWELVDRADAQSRVNAGPWDGRSLHELWTEVREEVFGRGLEGDRFPLLIKILDPADVLSVQVHPPSPVAARLAGEPKTELWYFAATQPGASIYAGLASGVTRQRFEAALADGTVPSVLHRIASRTDGFIFIPSGRLHAIDAGNVIFEIQQNSDTTYRVYDWDRAGLDGKPRELHPAQSLDSIDFDDHEPGLGTADGETLVNCEYFRVERWALSHPRSAKTGADFAAFQVARGGVRCGGRTFGPGDLFVVPAAAEGMEIIPQDGGATVVRTTLR